MTKQKLRVGTWRCRRSRGSGRKPQPLSVRESRVDSQPHTSIERRRNHPPKISQLKWMTGGGAVMRPHHDKHCIAFQGRIYIWPQFRFIRLQMRWERCMHDPPTDQACMDSGSWLPPFLSPGLSIHPSILLVVYIYIFLDGFPSHTVLAYNGLALLICHNTCFMLPSFQQQLN
jgi:hypothetical protein